ncbi:hypothetical protein J3L16_03855 [Alteromonas sp. 5E99-2]|uniref:hypothetical protein n=1 Tax=Alteromonas sp. 5E99-2 TaxID=2817683 RepID=UPI001A97DC13|nr:hypothetical protein [Alteromonas sp. 5E99-2]MBO1254822.1 hypothetical protein [Alteromonas sp. 5E99-2]
MDYQESTGRFSEVLIGIVTALISLVFFGLIYLIVINATLSVVSVVGFFVLALIGYWFAQISYRLLLQKQRNNGGLISPIALKFWCVVFAISSVGFLIFAAFEKDINAMFSAAVILPACWFGWKLANKRKQRNGI